MRNEYFINENFLLYGETAERLYFEYAAPQPMIDSHCHLLPKELAGNRIYQNRSRVWIDGNHYKWRAMRTWGIDEKYITGGATDDEKFLSWAKVVPRTLCNPLYHWTHLELKRYFGINELLNEDSASEIYREATRQLNSPDHSCRNLIRKMNGEYLLTTDDPTDAFQSHKEIHASEFETYLNTAFCPEKVVLINSSSYKDYNDLLARVSDGVIQRFRDLCDSLMDRMNYFHELGFRLYDHGLNYIPFRLHTTTDTETLFIKRRKNNCLSHDESEKFQTALLLFLSREYHRRGWVQQFHLGPLRNNSSRMIQRLGADTGWDSIGDYPQMSLSGFLNELDSCDNLTKTILYSLNPSDNEIMTSMTGNFNDGSMRGKLQMDNAWWFLDPKDGILQQLNALSNLGLLNCFIGMLTDSRSFLSFARHEYFRRILCNVYSGRKSRMVNCRKILILWVELLKTFATGMQKNILIFNL